VAEVERYCEGRVPEDMHADVRVEHGVRGNAITIVERRPPWREEVGPEWSSTKVAQLRYGGGMWTLYCADSSGRWWLYDNATPASRRRAAARRDRRGSHGHLLGLTRRNRSRDHGSGQAGAPATVARPGREERNGSHWRMDAGTRWQSRKGSFLLTLHAQ
jgi:hypothetical protein